MTVEFTYRDWEIYELLLRGFKYREIMKELGLVYGSVTGCVCMIRKKAGVKTNKEMISKIGNLPGWFTRYKCKERKNG